MLSLIQDRMAVGQWCARAQPSRDRITRRAHILSQLLEDGVPICADDMPARRSRTTIPDLAAFSHGGRLCSRPEYLIDCGAVPTV